MVAGLGSIVDGARNRAIGAESSLAGLDAMSASVSAVSLDEEMINLIRLEAAYQANARVIATVDTLLDDILTLI